jgi:membrane protein YqaA with SNARE-associated domain
MTILDGVIQWTIWFITTYGLSGTFVVAILESFIFPVPTVVMITPATALGWDPFIVTVVATIGSLMGAVVGYLLGRHFGHPVAVKLFKKKNVDKVEKWFERWGAWAVLIAAFSPVPFKVFTWASGIFGLDFRKFMIAAAIGRFAQFAIAAYVGDLLGPLILGLL